MPFTEMKDAKAQGYVSVLVDQASGYANSVIGALTNDTTQEQSGNARQKAGEARKEINS